MKKSLKFLIICMFFAALPVVFTACADESLVEPAAETPEKHGDGTGAIPVGTRSLPDGYEEAVIVYNPYSLENVIKMLEQMQEEGMTRANVSVDIAPTHYHVRFRPQTDEQYYLIKKNGSINVRLYPFDVDVPEGAIAYEDNDWIEGQIPFLFAVVPINFQFPYGIPYDILEELVDLESLGIALPPSFGGGGGTAGAPGGGAIVGNGNFRGKFAVSVAIAGEGPYKGGDMKKVPEGTIRVWDDLLKRYVPLKGVMVKIWSNMFFTHIVYTDDNGYFKSRYQFNDTVDYEIEWESDDYDIRHGKTGQAFTKMANETNQKISYNFGSANSNSEDYRYAGIHRAAYRYFYGDVGGLQKAVKHSGGANLKIAYLHKAGVSNFDSGTSWNPVGIFRDIEIYKIDSRSDVTLPHSRIVSTTFHEIAHATHCYKIGSSNFNNVAKYIQEGWACYVAWHLMQVEYKEICNKIGLSSQKRYDLIEDNFVDWGSWHFRQYWPYNVAGSPDFHNDLEYSPLFIDLIDDYNQQIVSRLLMGFEDDAYPNDDVKGYTPATLNSMVLQINSLSGLKSKLKATKPVGVTDAKINTLFTKYEELLL